MTLAASPLSSAPAIPSAQALMRRAKALAVTDPLHRLEDHKGRAGGGEFAAYTVRDLAQYAIELVAGAMDFDRGAIESDVTEALAAAAAAQQPGRPAEEHAELAAWVMRELIGTSSARGFSADYTDYADGATRRTFTFRVFDEFEAAGGGVHLRASTEAINVLFSSMDIDIASEEIAAQAVLESHVDRGRLDRAADSARAAKLRTIQYQESIRAKLAAVRRNLDTVDWDGDVSPQIVEALGHLEQRQAVEARILDSIQDRRDSAARDDLRRQAVKLIDVVVDCQRRHRELSGHLSSARETFRAELARQKFAPPASMNLRDLTADIIRPLLAETVAASGPLADQLFARLASPSAPAVMGVGSLIDQLLAPPRERAQLGAPVEAPELDDAEPEPAFSDDAVAAAERILAGVGGAPCRLSGLIASALDSGPQGAARLVWLEALGACSPNIGADVAAGRQRRRLAAWPDGSQLRGLPGFAGDDLLIAAITVTPAGAARPAVQEAAAA